MPRPPDRATRYARDVLAGRIVAGPYVRLACKRHVNDLKRSDMRFDLAAANAAIDFFEKNLTLSQSRWEGLPFNLFPWQAFVIGSLYGWLLPDGLRRFQKVFCLTGKGSGKSPLLAGVMLRQAFADGEAGPQVYMIACNSEQANICFTYCVEMVERWPALRARTKIKGGESAYEITYKRPGKSRAFLKRSTTSSGARGKSGFAVSALGVDEYHEHLTADMRDLYAGGFKARAQPVEFIITNAGAGLQSPCGEEFSHAISVVRNPTPEADHYFSYVCALDENDDPWSDEACWQKVNPSLPEVPGVPYIRKQMNDALGMPTKRSVVNRFNFCVWTEAEAPWIDEGAWRACEVQEKAWPSEERLRSLPCYLAVDLSTHVDLTAAVAVWREADLYFAEACAWIPRENLEAKERVDSLPYLAWEEAGFLRTTSEGVVDYTDLATWIVEKLALSKVQGLAYDAWNINRLVAKLREAGVDCFRGNEGFLSQGLKIFPHHQGFTSGKRGPVKDPNMRGTEVELWMPESMRELEAAIMSKRLTVRYSPVLRSAAMSAVAISDASGNRRLSKTKSINRIDALVALVMATGYASYGQGTPLTDFYSDGVQNKLLGGV